MNSTASLGGTAGRIRGPQGDGVRRSVMILPPLGCQSANTI